MSVSDEEILKLWHDKSFAGSFRGVKNFQVLLKTDRGINISQDHLLKLLKSDPIYLIHSKRQTNINRRQYDVNFYGQLVQIDIAYMFSESKDSPFKYFLLAIDVFSFKIFAEAIEDKTASSVVKALKKIFKNFNTPIYEIQSDRGKEFIGKDTKAFFKSLNILYRPKRGKNKASFAEYGILLVKRKLYMLMRSEVSQNWTNNLRNVYESLNNTPLKRLGWLTPNSIKTESDSVKVSEAKKLKNVTTYHEPTYSEQFRNQKEYDGDLKIGDFVYLDFEENLFDKSFDVSVCSFKFSLGKNLIYRYLFSTAFSNITR